LGLGLGLGKHACSSATHYVAQLLAHIWVMRVLAERRLGAAAYLQRFGPQLFPPYFSGLLHPFLGILATLDPDARVAAIEANFDSLAEVQPAAQRLEWGRDLREVSPTPKALQAAGHATRCCQDWTDAHDPDLRRICARLPPVDRFAWTKADVLARRLQGMQAASSALAVGDDCAAETPIVGAGQHQADSPASPVTPSGAFFSRRAICRVEMGTMLSDVQPKHEQQ